MFSVVIVVKISNSNFGIFFQSGGAFGVKKGLKNNRCPKISLISVIQNGGNKKVKSGFRAKIRIVWSRYSKVTF